jgi:hypothetical protein
MPDIDTITIVIKALPNGSASVLATLAQPRPGMRIENAAHSLALDALGWLGKQPATKLITYCDPAVVEGWIERVRHYITQETSERFLTTPEICAAHPVPDASSPLRALELLAQLMATQGWLRCMQRRAGKSVQGYARPSNADLLACEALTKELLDPEGYAHAVGPEVRNAARRSLDVKGQMEGLAA